MLPSGRNRGVLNGETAGGMADRMKLLDEIIGGAVNDTQPIGTVLRKCLVLERLEREVSDLAPTSLTVTKLR